MLIKLRSGKILSGPLHTWRPKEGWFSITKDPDGDMVKVQLAEVESAIDAEVRTHPLSSWSDRPCLRCGKVQCTGTERVDRVVLAKKEGWDGT